MNNYLKLKNISKTFNTNKKLTVLKNLSYNFEKGKPWQSESLQAPFGFAIKKTDEEIAIEEKGVIDNAMLYFDLDNSILKKVNVAYEEQFKAIFPDTIPNSISNKLYKTGEGIFSELYKYGVLSDNYDFSKDRSIVVLDGREKKLDGFYSNLIEQSDVTAVIESVLDKNNLSNFISDFVALCFCLVKFNLKYYKIFSFHSITTDEI